MIFTTYWFLVFAAIVIPAYWLLSWRPARWGFLAVACAVFHAHFAGPAGMAPIIVLMIFTFFAGMSRNRALCIAAMALCVLTLCFYKYAVFFIGMAIHPFHAGMADQLIHATESIMPAAPPLGLSFFTFEFVHYLFEVKNGGEPIRNPLKFVLFAIFFPSLVAGPIKRYGQFLPSLETGSRKFHVTYIADGVRRIAMGYFKKVLIADNLTALIDHYQPGYDGLGLTARWLLLAAIAFRILMDFAGYSDIAIGFAKLLGVELPENFNWPYVARNLQDFWARWHISLSTWIRDYVYIPLGGNRHGTPRRVVNLLIAFALCGLWHGPARHFIVWGLFHGVGLMVCATYRKVPGLGTALGRVFDKEPLVGLVITQLYAWIGWLVFFYPVHEALHMAKGLFGQ